MQGFSVTAKTAMSALLHDAAKRLPSDQQLIDFRVVIMAHSLACHLPQCTHMRCDFSLAGALLAIAWFLSLVIAEACTCAGGATSRNLK